ncbi:MAG TPA: FHA domain-containing protein [Bryobacteraceae bacterium]|nr:FHA domain-containing protein [Bryobacteraceae bacterium]
MRSLQDLDRWIAEKVKRHLAGAAPQRRELLEVRRDLLEDVRVHIEPKGAGKVLFPYNSLVARIVVLDDAEAERLRAAAEALEADVRELLAEAGCPVPALTLEMDVKVAEEASFAVEYVRRAAAPATVFTRPAAKLVVLAGEADAAEIEIAANRVNLGRMKEVSSERDGLRRRNDLAFAESETTVSREHAYLIYDAGSGKFRLCDYQSTRGTAVFRDGRRIDVPRASPRGVPLQSGDEIHLGAARVRFVLAG